MTELGIFEVDTDRDFLDARHLFEEYADALDVDLDFQNFRDELSALRQMYGPPRGCLLLARCDGAVVGCAALRPLGGEVCEMKRLYVRPEARGLDIGRGLATAIIERARRSGYRRIVLDTLGSMTPAPRLYRSLGFREIEAYYPNPIEDAVYLALDL